MALVFEHNNNNQANRVLVQKAFSNIIEILNCPQFNLNGGNNQEVGNYFKRAF